MFYKRCHNGTSCLCGIAAELMVRKSSFIILIYEIGGGNFTLFNCKRYRIQCI